MDLLKKYGSKELARKTFRDLQDRRKKKIRDADTFLFDRYKRVGSDRIKANVM